jgi:hypothetical protein
MQPIGSYRSRRFRSAVYRLAQDSARETAAVHL